MPLTVERLSLECRLHFQMASEAQTKLVRVLSGERVFIPVGFAHVRGYLANPQWWRRIHSGVYQGQHPGVVS